VADRPTDPLFCFLFFFKITWLDPGRSWDFNLKTSFVVLCFLSFRSPMYFGYCNSNQMHGSYETAPTLHTTRLQMNVSSTPPTKIQSYSDTR
jgi:hypothetical protein